MYSKIPTSNDVHAGAQQQQTRKGCCEDILGFSALQNLHRDAIVLIMCRVVRLFSFGFLSVMLVVYLQELNLSEQRIGLMFSLTLLGDMLISLVLTSHADRWGRRKSLMVGAVLSIITGIVFSFQSNFWCLLISAIFGVISPSGNEIGPFMAIELSALSQLTQDSERTRLMAWYNLFGSFSSAFGALFCGWIYLYLRAMKTTQTDIQENVYYYDSLTTHRIILMIYTVCQVIKLFFFSILSPAIEVPQAVVKEVNPVSLFLGLHKSKAIVLKLSCLFTLDSFAGAFVLQSMMSAWFVQVYHTQESILGTMIFFCFLVAGISALFAAKLADYIGLVMTMVVTHLPSNVLLILVPLMPNETWSIIMLCARFCISQMDVPTRNAYVQGVVDPDERSAANGITNVVRSLGACLAPYLAEILYSNPAYRNYPFYIAGVLKIVYDLLLVGSFLSVKPDNEKQPLVSKLTKPLLTV